MKQTFVFSMIIMLLRGIQYCVVSSVLVIESFFMSDIGFSRTFVSLIAFNKADPLTASLTLLLFFRVVAAVGNGTCLPGEQ